MINIHTVKDNKPLALIKLECLDELINIYDKYPQFRNYPLFLSEENAQAWIDGERKRYRETKSKDWGGKRQGAGRKRKSST